MHSSTQGGGYSAKPRTEFWAVLATVIAGLALVFDVSKTLVEPKPKITQVSYHIKSDRIFDSKYYIGIKVVTKDGTKEIAGDIFATEYTIWNSGSEGISGDKIEPGVEKISTSPD